MPEGSQIEGGAAFLMMTVAVLIDFIQFLLTIILIGFIINPVISLFATMLFSVWFSHYGISLMSWRITLGFLGTIVIEFVFGTIPAWSFLVGTTIAASKVKQAIQPPAITSGRWRL